MILKEGEYLVYTDGSCRQKTGGWGFVILLEQGLRVCGYGGLINCTNNQAEMMAAVMALSCFEGDNTIIVTTDSRYLQNGMKSHIYKWSNNGYKTSTGGRVKNRKLWKRLYKLQLDQAPAWEWVRSHSGDKYNEMADHLALQGRLYAESGKRIKKRETTLHNFFNISNNKDKKTKLLMHGEPKIYCEDY